VPAHLIRNHGLPQLGAELGVGALELENELDPPEEGLRKREPRMKVVPRKSLCSGCFYLLMFELLLSENVFNEDPHVRTPVPTNAQDVLEQDAKDDSNPLSCRFRDHVIGAAFVPHLIKM
jgi:hypothetical protein